MASVREIARKSGVSITTVSRVLNNHPAVSSQARDRVLAAANRTRYVAPVGRRSTTNIAFVYLGESSLGSPFDAALMQGMSGGLDEAGFDLLVLNARRARREGETFSQLFMRKGVRGAILRSTAATFDACREIAAEGFPAVLVADEFDAPKLRCVTSDARPACRRAIEHLLHLGHRRIAITLNIVDDHDHQQRLEAYREALAAAGVEADPRLELRVPAYRDAGAQALRQIFAIPDQPTAVFVTDPMAAVGLFHEAHRTGVSIPQDLSVLGFDDSDQRFGTYPRMTAVCQDAEALGRAAFAALQQLIEDPNQTSPMPKCPECWLEIHESVGLASNQT